MSPGYDVSFDDVFFLEATPDELWSSLQRTDLFERWWKWIRDVRLQGEALAEGSSIAFGIDPPSPYRMNVSVEVTRSLRPELLEGRVDGDLKGKARLAFDRDGAGTRAHVTWDVEIANPAIRLVFRIARPILLRTQRWAVDVSLRGFRAHLARGTESLDD